MTIQPSNPRQLRPLALIALATAAVIAAWLLTWAPTIDSSALRSLGVSAILLALLWARCFWTSHRQPSIAHAPSHQPANEPERSNDHSPPADSSTEQLAEIARRTCNGVVLTDREGFIKWVNEGFTRITGYTLREAEGRKPGTLLQGRDSDPVEVARLRDAVRNGHGTTTELVNYSKDGRAYLIKIELIPQHTAEGALCGFMAIETDVTEQRRVEASLRQLSERFELATRAGGVGTWDFEIAKGRVHWDEQMFRLYGLAHDQRDVAYGAWLARIHPEDCVRCDFQIQQALRGELEFDTEFRIVCPDTSVRFIRAISRIQRDQHGHPVRMIGTNWDVTAAHQAELELKRTQQFLAKLLDSIEAQTVVVASDGRIHAFNTAWRNFAIANGGRAPAVLEGADYLATCDRAAHHCAEAVAVAKAIRAVLAGDASPPPIEYPCHAPHERRWFLCSVRGFTCGNQRYAAISHHNVTTLKLAEIKLKAANAALAAAQARAQSATIAKSAFLANMSHEIRTPLTAIMGFADVLRDDTLNPAPLEQRLQSIDTIRSAGSHLLAVINDILDLSKIEADKMTIERIDTPLGELLGDVYSLLRPRALDKGIALDISFATLLPERIISDPTRLRQILVNLAGNAIKFTDTGCVGIIARVTELKNQPHLVFDIHDTGQGLTPEQAAGLFHPFEQADETVTRKHGGSGLGLTISRRLAAIMGGDVELVTSEPGTGSCFRLSLPLQAAAGSAMITQLPATHTAAAPRADSLPIKLTGRILLVEDGLDNQRLIARHLRNAGATVEIADNGVTALQLIDHTRAAGHHFDLLLTDMQMPEMDGYTLARTLRERGSTIAIIALTAHAMTGDRDKCLAAGCTDYATKPIDRVRLLATCAEWIGRSHAAAGPSIAALESRPGA